MSLSCSHYKSREFSAQVFISKMIAKCLILLCLARAVTAQNPYDLLTEEQKREMAQYKEVSVLNRLRLIKIVQAWTKSLEFLRASLRDAENSYFLAFHEFAPSGEKHGIYGS